MTISLRRFVALLTALTLLLAACGDGGEPSTGDGDTGTSGDGGTGASGDGGTGASGDGGIGTGGEEARGPIDIWYSNLSLIHI